MIPKVIWQTYKTTYDELPEIAKVHAEEWQRLNPDYQYNYLSDDDVCAFTEKYYGKKMLKLLQSFKVPVMKADLWRILVIYEKGGIYSDIDTAPTVSLDSWIDTSRSMIVAIENGIHYTQWSFMAEPKNPIIKSILDVIVERCQNIDYNKKDLVHYYTANDAFAEGIRKYFNLPSLKHECRDMNLKKNCNCGYLQKEALTYKNNKKMIKERFYCFSGDEWATFTTGKIVHYFGSFFWKDEGLDYQSWLNNPIAEKSRNFWNNEDLVFYFCYDAVFNKKNSGIQRVTRLLGKALQNAGKVLIPVGYNPTNKTFFILDDDQIKGLEIFNGPSVDKIENTKTMDEYLKFVDVAIFPELTNAYINHTKDISNMLKSVKKYFIFYDCIPNVLPENYSDSYIANHLSYIKDLKDANIIFSISMESTNDYIKFFGSPSKNITTLPLPNQFVLGQKSLPKKINTSKNIDILTVSTLETRKNHKRLITAFTEAQKELEEQGYNLTLHLVGASIPSHPIEYGIVLNAIKNKNIIWHEVCSDEELLKLYAKADFTIYPSLYEGFGLPVTESLFFNTPCILSKGAGMDEFFKIGGCLPFNPLKVVDLKAKIIQLATDYNKRDELVKNISNTNSYSWDDYAKDILKSIEKDKK